MDKTYSLSSVIMVAYVMYSVYFTTEGLCQNII